MLAMHCDNCGGWVNDNEPTLENNYITCHTEGMPWGKPLTWHFCCMNCAGVYFISHSQPTEEV